MKFLKNLFDRRPKVTAVIEMPQGSVQKIEIKNGLPVVDRILDIPVPSGYGYIPGTLAEDGDPLDIFVYSNKYNDTGRIVDVRIIGMFVCLDQGVPDHKLLAIEEGESCKTVDFLCQVGHYLKNYKEGFEVIKWKSKVTLKDIKKYQI